MSKSMMKLNELKDLVKSNNVIIEGYNYVGKSYLINKIQDSSIVVDKKSSTLLPEEIRWAYLLSFMSLLDYMDKSKKFIFNKSILSGDFYNRIRSPEIKQLLTLEIFDQFKKLVLVHDIKIVLIEVDKSKYKKFVKEQNEIINPDSIYEDYMVYCSSIKKMVEFLDLEDQFYIYKNEELI